MLEGKEKETEHQTNKVTLLNNVRLLVIDICNIGYTQNLTPSDTPAIIINKNVNCNRLPGNQLQKKKKKNKQFQSNHEVTEGTDKTLLYGTEFATNQTLR